MRKHQACSVALARQPLDLPTQVHSSPAACTIATSALELHFSLCFLA